MSDCILWKGPAWSKGRYGVLRVNGKNISAHRYEWIKHYGEIPENMYVCHSCDNGLCINIEHLFLGTAKDNMQDCINKGRFKFLRKDQKGQNNYNFNKSNPNIAHRNSLIKKDRESGMTYSSIKIKYGIKSNGHLRTILKS